MGYQIHPLFNRLCNAWKTFVEFCLRVGVETKKYAREMYLWNKKNKFNTWHYKKNIVNFTG